MKEENDQVACFLTKEGKQIFSLSIIDRQLEFIKIILTHSVFKKTLKLYFENATLPTKEEIVEIMKDSKIYKVSKESTYFRRASTITRWINWIMSQIEA